MIFFPHELVVEHFLRDRSRTAGELPGREVAQAAATVECGRHGPSNAHGVLSSAPSAGLPAHVGAIGMVIVLGLNAGRDRHAPGRKSLRGGLKQHAADLPVTLIVAEQAQPVSSGP